MDKGERKELERQFDDLMNQITANSSIIKKEIHEDDLRLICCFLSEIRKMAHISSESHGLDICDKRH